MGEAKRRQGKPVDTVYHHTSTLRTNLIWMSGVIELEGRSEGAFHPVLGEVKVNALSRRALNDFPPLAWFTKQSSRPKCLAGQIQFVDKVTGEVRQILDDEVASKALTLDPIALGFRLAGSTIVPWRDHSGYTTDEGAELNRTAIEWGDNPDDWYVSEQPIDLMTVVELWRWVRGPTPRLVKADAETLLALKKMIHNVRTTPGAYVPPSWLTLDQARALAHAMGKPILEP